MAVWGLLPAQIGVVSSIYTGKLSLNGNTRKVGWATSSGTACGHLCCFQTHDTAPLQCDAHILMHASHDPHLYARCTCTIAGTPGSRMVGFSSNLAAGTHAIAVFFLLRRMSDTMALLSQGFTASAGFRQTYDLEMVSICMRSRECAVAGFAEHCDR
jgi:hypothetical protein